MKTKIQYLLVLVVLTLTGHAGHVHASPSSDDKDNRCAGHNSVAPPLVHGLYDHYEISGSCEQELQNDLTIKASRWSDGHKYDSVTRWRVGWDYGYDRTGGVCAADGFRLTVDIVISIPAWLHRNAAPSHLVEKWDSYIEKLREHENEHLEKVVQAAEELTRAVAKMPSAATCEDLDRQVRILSRNRLKMLEQEQHGYDIETAHGWTQGALFP